LDGGTVGSLGDCVVQNLDFGPSVELENDDNSGKPHVDPL
jgi:hypothetical protein